MKSAKAFAPANISCIFRIYKNKYPRWAGSYGVGFTLSEGAIVEASKSNKNSIIFNDKKLKISTVESVLKKLTDKKVKIKIKSKFPLGCGFGISGACALASAYAINKLYNLKKSKKELAIIAHTADVENDTGLGDVVNQYHGGFLIKNKPSSHFVVNKLNINNYVYCNYFSKLSTKSIITNKQKINKIDKSSIKSINKIKMLKNNNKKIKFCEIIRLSKEFALESGLLKDKKVINTIKTIERKGGSASMIMLGNAVFSDKPFKGSMKLIISDKGARLL